MVLNVAKLSENFQKTVFLVKFRGIPNYYVSKTYLQTKNPALILNELKILHKLKCNLYIVSCLACYNDNNDITLVFPYFVHSKYKDIYLKTNFEEIKLYMKNLFKALEYIHKENIIHGDIKPDNFLYDHLNKKYKLIDLEHASSNSKDDSLQCNFMGTPGYIAPEILLNKNLKTPAIDIWGAAVIMASFMSGCYPFFNIKTNNYENLMSSSIIQITLLLGIDGFEDINKISSIKLDTNIQFPKQDLTKLCNVLRESLGFNNILSRQDMGSGCEILSQIFIINFYERLTAEEVINSHLL